MRLLQPYLRDLVVNGKECKVLRDSAATMDIHPAYVEAKHLTGECAWIKQVVEKNSVCLPTAKVKIEGPFGVLETEAAVSPNLPKQYPYLFANKSDFLLRQKGLSFGEFVAQAITRSKARELAVLTSNENEQTAAADHCEPAPASTRDEGNKVAARTVDDSSDDEGPIQSSPEASACYTVEQAFPHIVLPHSKSLLDLLNVDKEALAQEQEVDPSMQNLEKLAQEGVAHRNISFKRRSGILYRQCKDKKGIHYDQLVVPSKYREQIIRLSHGEAWACHLGVKKTKARLLREFYWPRCFKDVEEYVQTCDACQRVGKPHEIQKKTPMKLVPLITEPFRRLVVYVVGPLPMTKSGHKYILTMISPAKKFPETIPVSVVEALLSVFTRIGFPAELQSDQGSVFTSAMTTAFLERCRIRIVRSSVRHPQSNSVKAWHAVLKRVLRMHCYEQNKDWEVHVGTRHASEPECIGGNDKPAGSVSRMSGSVSPGTETRIYGQRFQADGTLHDRHPLPERAAGGVSDQQWTAFVPNFGAARRMLGVRECGVISVCGMHVFHTGGCAFYRPAPDGVSEAVLDARKNRDACYAHGTNGHGLVGSCRKQTFDPGGNRLPKRAIGCASKA